MPSAKPKEIIPLLEVNVVADFSRSVILPAVSVPTNLTVTLGDEIKEEVFASIKDMEPPVVGPSVLNKT